MLPVCVCSGNTGGYSTREECYIHLLTAPRGSPTTWACQSPTTRLCVHQEGSRQLTDNTERAQHATRIKNRERKAEIMQRR